MKRQHVFKYLFCGLVMALLCLIVPRNVAAVTPTFNQVCLSYNNQCYPRGFKNFAAATCVSDTCIEVVSSTPFTNPQAIFINGLNATTGVVSCHGSYPDMPSSFDWMGGGAIANGNSACSNNHGTYANPAGGNSATGYIDNPYNFIDKKGTYGLSIWLAEGGKPADNNGGFGDGLTAVQVRYVYNTAPITSAIAVRQTADNGATNVALTNSYVRSGNKLYISGTITDPDAQNFTVSYAMSAYPVVTIPIWTVCRSASSTRMCGVVG